MDLMALLVRGSTTATAQTARQQEVDELKNSRWSSTATFGYVNLQNAGGQAGDAYDFTYYTSGNLVYQLFKRLSVDAEVLYGRKEVKSGNTGDDVRVQFGAVHSVFD
jgi:hypothetical protein